MNDKVLRTLDVDTFRNILRFGDVSLLKGTVFEVFYMAVYKAFALLFHYIEDNVIIKTVQTVQRDARPSQYSMFDPLLLEESSEIDTETTETIIHCVRCEKDIYTSDEDFELDINATKTIIEHAYEEMQSELKAILPFDYLYEEQFNSHLLALIKAGAQAKSVIEDTLLDVQEGYVTYKAEIGKVRVKDSKVHITPSDIKLIPDKIYCLNCDFVTESSTEYTLHRNECDPVEEI